MVARLCRFKSCYPHQTVTNPNPKPVGEGFGFVFYFDDLNLTSGKKQNKLKNGGQENESEYR